MSIILATRRIFTTLDLRFQYDFARFFGNRWLSLDSPMNGKHSPEQHPASENRQDASTTTRVIQSHEILQGAREVQIEHEGELYRLRLTRNGKLILHK